MEVIVYKISLADSSSSIDYYKLRACRAHTFA